MKTTKSTPNPLIRSLRFDRGMSLYPSRAADRSGGVSIEVGGGSQFKSPSPSSGRTTTEGPRRQGRPSGGLVRWHRRCETSQRVPVMPDAPPGSTTTRSNRSGRRGTERSVRERAAVDEPVGRRPDPDALAMVDGLLGQAEVPIGAPADLHDHERGRWTRVDRHEVQLVATDMDVPGQDGPTGVRQTCRDQRLGGITRLLGRRPPRVVGSVRHGGIVAGDPYPRRIRRGRRAPGPRGRPHRASRRRP